MMKNEKGVTLMALSITIMLIFILASVTIKGINEGAEDVQDNKLNAELGIIRQAITEQYMLAKAVGELKVPATNEQVTFWIGDRIESASTIELPEANYNSKDSNGTKFFNRIANYQPVYQEDFYYRLSTEEQLKELGITRGDFKCTYIVNYSTGEVYNETNQVTSDSYLLYMPSTIYDIDSKTEDTNLFNDWN